MKWNTKRSRAMRLIAAVVAAIATCALLIFAEGPRANAQMAAYPKCKATSPSPCPTCAQSGNASRCDVNLNGWTIGSCVTTQLALTPCSTHQTSCGDKLDCDEEDPQIIGACPAEVNLCTN